MPAPPCENATSSSSRAAAAPESSASRAISMPSRRSAAWPPAAIAPAAFSRIAERRPPLPPVEHLADPLRRSRPASPPRSSAGSQRGDAELERVDLALAAPSPSTTSQTRFGPAGESSSMPPAPCTTNARRAPSCASTSAITGHELRRVDADDLGARAGRVRQRPEHVEDRTRRELACAPAPACFIAGGGSART